MTDVLFPETLDQTLDLLASKKKSALLAGGTDLLVRMRQNNARPAVLISLDRVAGMRKILDTGQEIIIGAGAPLASVMEHETVREHAGVLVQAISVLGSPQIRNMGTLGGNIMTASPAGDSLPPLYVLDSRVELAGPEGIRQMRLDQFILGPGKTCITPGEILWQVVFNKPEKDTCHWFEKVGQRTALSISMVSMAALYTLDENKAFSTIRLAWGSVGPTIVTSPETENQLVGNRAEPGILAKAAALARAGVSPISDIRARADYRRQVAGNLIMRLNPDCRNVGP